MKDLLHEQYKLLDRSADELLIGPHETTWRLMYQTKKALWRLQLFNGKRWAKYAAHPRKEYLYREVIIYHNRKKLGKKIYFQGELQF